MAAVVQVTWLAVSNDVITLQQNISNTIYSGVYIYLNTNQVYYLCYKK